MRQKSKDAARQRRENEKSEFLQLARLLPLSLTITSQLDTASIIRLTLSYSWMRKVFPHSCKSRESPNTFMNSITKLENELLNNDLDCFLLMLSPEGRILFVSGSATKQLGIPQHELIGTNIYEHFDNNEYSFDDANSLRQILKANESESESQSFQTNGIKLHRNFSLRLKCLLSKRSAGLTVPNTNLKLIHFTGCLKLKRLEPQKTHSSPSDPDSSHNTPCFYENMGLVAIGQSITPTAKSEIQLNEHTFMFRATEDLKIVFVESSLTTLTGYEPSHLVNKTLYQFIHPDDLWAVCSSHQEVIWKSQSITKYYRFLALNGGWVWIQSTFTLVHNPKSSRPTCILGINQVISERESQHEMLALVQLQNSKASESNFHNISKTSTSSVHTSPEQCRVPNRKIRKPLKRKRIEEIQTNSEQNQIAHKIPRYNLASSTKCIYDYAYYHNSEPDNYHYYYHKDAHIQETKMFPQGQGSPDHHYSPNGSSFDYNIQYQNEYSDLSSYDQNSWSTQTSPSYLYR